MPLLPANRNANPSNQAGKAQSRHQRDLVERTKTMARRKPKAMLRAPRTRPKMMRGLLPLAVDQ